jgi:hypothetical protein
MIRTYRRGELRELIADARRCEALRPGRTARTLTLTAAAALTIWAGALTFGSRTVATSSPVSLLRALPGESGQPPRGQMRRACGDRGHVGEEDCG